MYDMNETSDVNAMLKEHFEYVSSGGTPLRKALEHAAAQFKRTDSGAPIYDMCQKNFTLLFTDGYNSGTSAAVNNADGSATAPYADGYSNTLGDIAFHHYKTALRGGDGFPAGQVTRPAECNLSGHDPWLDCNRDLHMNTYMVGLGAKGTIYNNTVGGVSYNSVSDAYANPPTWPNVNSARDARQIDDLYHAAVNGRGEMYSADSPAELKDALGSALQSIAAVVGSGSGVTFNSSSLRSTDGSAVYTTSFNSGDWSGNVKAKLLNSTSGAVEGDAWGDGEGNSGVAALLDAQENDARIIFTMGENDTGDAEGVVFEYDNLTATQKTDLKTNADGTIGNDANGESRVAYIRGFFDSDSIQVPDGSGGTRTEPLRNRSSRLGDVVHSTPLFVGKPASIWPNRGYFGSEGKRYINFVSGDASSREPMLYVGANDGMLHGFNATLSGADAGQEAFAYVPGAAYSSEAKAGLHYLSDPNYAHRYYADLTPVAQDVFIVTDPGDLGSPSTDADRDEDRDWTTLLVGGMRTGGRGIFALDVTDPDDFTNSATKAEETVLWEFTDAHTDDMGYLDEGVSIAMLNDQKWAVIFGNGYNSENGEAGVFILYVEEGIDGTWTVNDDYRFLGTDVGSSGDKNGLSTVSVADLDGDRVADRIYGGDLKGNMWAFDISSDNPSTWGSAYMDGSAPEALFVATDADGDVQPITAAPGLAANSEQSVAGNAPNVFVTFGTGQYLVSGDQLDDSLQSYYTIWDNGNSAGGAIERADLATRALSKTGDVLKMAGDAIDWTQQQGWYFDFAVNSSEEGERLVNKPLLRSDKEVGPVAIFASMIPGESACEGGGSSALYAIPLADGLNPTKAIMDLDGDGVEAIDDAGDSDDRGVGTTRSSLLNDPNCLGNTCYSSLGDYTTLGGTETLDQTAIDIESGSERLGRLGWYEM
jgi:type IV pilus assembly protein PilY1